MEQTLEERAEKFLHDLGVGFAGDKSAKLLADFAEEVLQQGEKISEEEIKKIAMRLYPTRIITDPDRPEHPFDVNFSSRHAAQESMRSVITLNAWQQRNRGKEGVGDACQEAGPGDLVDQIMQVVNEWGKCSWCDGEGSIGPEPCRECRETGTSLSNLEHLRSLLTNTLKN